MNDAEAVDVIRTMLGIVRARLTYEPNVALYPRIEHRLINADGKDPRNHQIPEPRSYSLSNVLSMAADRLEKARTEITDLRMMLWALAIANGGTLRIDRDFITQWHPEEMWLEITRPHPDDNVTRVFARICRQPAEGRDA
jgi:hypothetical protein